MADEPSIVAKTERAFDDLAGLWNRRRRLCLLIGVIIVGPSCFSIYLQLVAIPKLEGELSSKNSEIAVLRADVTKIEHERDKAELRLAPYLAAEQRGFPNVPVDKRTDLLLARLELAVRSIEDAALGLSRERTIAPEVRRAMVTDLKGIPPMTVEIVSVFGDREAAGLSAQIKEVFQEAGWKVERYGESIMFPTPKKPLTVTLGKVPSPQLQLALAHLFNSFGYEREAGIDKQLGESNLKIIVAAK